MTSILCRMASGQNLLMVRYTTWHRQTPDIREYYHFYTWRSGITSAKIMEPWIVDPIKQVILVYDMENDAAPSIYSFFDKIKANIYEDLYINFSDISNLLNI